MPANRNPYRDARANAYEHSYRAASYPYRNARANIYKHLHHAAHDNDSAPVHGHPVFHMPDLHCHPNAHAYPSCALDRSLLSDGSAK
jgi:hypothetical protein